MQDNLEDFNYDHIDYCAECDSKQMGTELHAHDAMGMATPVLWMCHRCENPPMLVGLYRRVKMYGRLNYNRVRYIMRTTRAERAARLAKIATVRAKMKARGVTEMMI